MGSCVSNTDEDIATPTVTTQRRRLSVDPTKVGDITKTYTRKASIPCNDESAALTEGSNIEGKGPLADAASSRKGYVPYNRGKVNQDRALVAYGLNGDPDISVFGVMDGHGEFGHLVADFVMRNLKKFLEEEPELKEKPNSSISSSVNKLVESLNEKKINCHFSGTTCVFGLLLEKTLYVANIGDSRAVMACRNGTTIEAKALSRDHKPEVPEEAARIKENGGRIQTLPGPQNEDCGPLRVWLADVNVPGLAMSRSIGDNVCQDVGVIHEPEIIPHEIQENDLFAIWASDGVWEFLSNEQAVNIVWENRQDLKIAANKLVEESANKWKLEEEVIDDITCVIIQFNEF